MAEAKFIGSLEDLTGKVAIVTGGAAGIGLWTTIYLARKGCNVYVASRNREKSLLGIQKAIGELRDDRGVGDIKFHHLDLASVTSSKASADAFRKLESRIDIIVGNAGVSMLDLSVLSEDGVERMMATNHLGHFAFIMALLDIVEKTAASHGEGRIVITSSFGYKWATKLDFTALKTTIPNDGAKPRHLTGALWRYSNSKLANIYFASELDRRLQDKGVKNIYCISCEPGLIGATGLGRDGFHTLPRFALPLIVLILGFLGNTVEDGAKTQTYLAASKEIREQNVHGQYWAPSWSWTGRWIGCGQQELTELAKDDEEQRKLWEWSEGLF